MKERRKNRNRNDKRKQNIYENRGRKVHIGKVVDTPNRREGEGKVDGKDIMGKERKKKHYIFLIGFVPT